MDSLERVRERKEGVMSRYESFPRVRKVAGTGLKRLLLGLLVAGASLASEAQAQRVFSNRSIEGRWALAADRTIMATETTAALPIVIIGVATFAESRRCVLAVTLNAGGNHTSASSQSCEFTVNADGTGSLAADFPGEQFPPLALTFVVVNDKEIRAIRLDDIVARGGER